MKTVLPTKEKIDCGGYNHSVAAIKTTYCTSCYKHYCKGCFNDERRHPCIKDNNIFIKGLTNKLSHNPIIKTVLGIRGDV